MTANVLWLFLMVSLVGLQCVIVVIPDHTHLLFCNLQNIKLVKIAVHFHLQQTTIANVAAFSKITNKA